MAPAYPQFCNGNGRVATQAPLRHLVVGFDELAVMGQAVEERRGHLGVAEDGRPFAEGEVGCDDDRGAFVEAVDQVEEQLSAGLREGQI
jgi:hypothetical protein